MMVMHIQNFMVTKCMDLQIASKSDTHLIKNCLLSCNQSIVAVCIRHAHNHDFKYVP